MKLDYTASKIITFLNEDPDTVRAASRVAQTYGIPLDQAQQDVEAVIAAIRGTRADRVDRGHLPSLSGIRAVIQLWRRQTWRLRLATLKVAAIVTLIEVSLPFVPLNRLSRWLGVPLTTGGAPIPPIKRDDLTLLNRREQLDYWAVSWVMDRWLFDATCLRRALAFGWCIRARGPLLRLGMLDKQGAIAHAWIELDGQFFNAQPVTGTFVTGVPELDDGGTGPSH